MAKVPRFVGKTLSSLALITLGFLLAIGFHKFFLEEEIIFHYSPTWIEGQPGVPGIYALLIILSLAILYGLYSNHYLYKWRQKLSSEPHLLMPEEYIEKMERFEAPGSYFHRAVCIFRGRVGVFRRGSAPLPIPGPGPSGPRPIGPRPNQPGPVGQGPLSQDHWVI